MRQAVVQMEKLPGIEEYTLGVAEYLPDPGVFLVRAISAWYNKMEIGLSPLKERKMRYF